MPFNIAMGNSSGYNYASGRLDHQTYYKSLRVERSDCEAIVLDPILAAWIREARTSLDLAIPDGVAHQWFWDGTEHVDPDKEAKAQTRRLINNTTTLAHECARQGQDWERVLEQRAKEMEKMKTLGLQTEEKK